MILIEDVIGGQLLLLRAKNFLFQNGFLLQRLKTVPNPFFLLNCCVLPFELRNRLIGLALAQNVFSNLVIVFDLLRDDPLLKDLALRETVLDRVLLNRSLSEGMLILVETPVVISVLLIAWFVIMMRFLIKLLGLIFLFF